MTGTEQPEPNQRRQRRMAAVLAVLAAFALLGPALSRATFSSSSSNTGRIGSAMDWAPPVVSVVDPGDGIRGTVSIGADASDDGLGVASVSIAWAPSGTTTFTVLCTDTTAPYACPFATAGLPEDEVDLKAVATDRAGFIATDVLEGVLVDNVAPTGSIGTLPSPVISGVITVPVTAADAGTGVASVVVQRNYLGSTWTTVCTDVEAPYSCRFDTTTVLTGTSVSFRAVVTDGAGNALTTATASRTVSNLVDSVSVEDPGAFVRGTATISANAASTVGVASVRIQRQAVGTTTWVDICTDATAPYSCAWATTTTADGLYNLQAILTNTLGATTTSALVGPTRVDNTVVRGQDVQGGAIAGTAGRIGAGDSFSVTYTRTIQPGSLLAGWTGSSRSVVIRLRDGGLVGLTGSDDTIDVFTTTGYATAVNLGTVNLKGNYVKAKKTAAFNATISLQSVLVNGTPATQVVLTVTGVASGTVRTAGGTPTMVWTPSALALDTAGIATSTAPVTELGPADRDV